MRSNVWACITAVLALLFTTDSVAILLTGSGGTLDRGESASLSLHAVYDTGFDGIDFTTLSGDALREKVTANVGAWL